MKLRLPVPDQDQAAPLSACARQLGDFVGACRGDKKTHLASLRPAIEAAYGKYVAAVASLAKVTPAFSTGTSDGDRLFDCYESGSGVDRAILEEVRRVSVGHCPYCGLRMRLKPKSRSPDRDHFLPRSVFPEFAVLSINLVLCCDDCNSAKGAHFKDAKGNDLFLHPYFDRLLGVRVLKAQATLTRGTVLVAFEVDDSAIAAADVERVRRHVDALGILDRMADEALAQLRVPMSALVTDDGSVDQLRDGLIRLSLEELRARPNCPVGLALGAVGAMVNLEDVWNTVRESQVRGARP